MQETLQRSKKRKFEKKVSGHHLNLDGMDMLFERQLTEEKLQCNVGSALVDSKDNQALLPPRTSELVISKTIYEDSQ